MNNDDLKEFANILFAPSERDEYKRRIDKAIEYIENECLDDDYNYCLDLCGNDIFEVLDILKGSDKDDNNSNCN